MRSRRHRCWPSVSAASSRWSIPRRFRNCSSTTKRSHGSSPTSSPTPSTIPPRIRASSSGPCSMKRRSRFSCRISDGASTRVTTRAFSNAISAYRAPRYRAADWGWRLLTTWPTSAAAGLNYSAARNRAVAPGSGWRPAAVRRPLCRPHRPRWGSHCAADPLGPRPWSCSCWCRYRRPAPEKHSNH